MTDTADKVILLACSMCRAPIHRYRRKVSDGVEVGPTYVDPCGHAADTACHTCGEPMQGMNREVRYLSDDYLLDVSVGDYPDEPIPGPWHLEPCGHKLTHAK